MKWSEHVGQIPPGFEHAHIDEADARFVEGTDFCCECVGRAFIMATVGPSEVVTASRVNAILDRLRAERAS